MQKDFFSEKQGECKSWKLLTGADGSLPVLCPPEVCEGTMAWSATGNNRF